MKKNTEQKGLDLYNELRGQMSQMTIEEMDNFKIELKGSKEEIEECMKCAEANNESCNRYENSQVIFGEKMDMSPVRHYNNLIIEACKNAMKKEDKNMNGHCEIIEFTIDGVKYRSTRPGYFYRQDENNFGKRINEAEWEQAWDAYITETEDAPETDEEQAEFNEMIENTKKQEAESDKMAEDAVNNKVRKPRRSKDIAFESTIALADDKIADVTLTAKQVKFIQTMPNDDFYENGLDSTLWIDCFCDTLADVFSPMAVGAMVSTLREKDIIFVDVQKVNGKKAKYFGFTELGKQVAKELGLN